MDEIVIYYCRTCKFGAPAEAIAAALREEFQVNVTLREAFWGTFRIEHAGQEIFNRWKTRGWLGRIGCGRTPTPTEIAELVRARIQPTRQETTPANSTAG